MNIERDIHSLTDFKRHTPEFLKQLKATGEPVVLTVNGKAEVVVQDAASYQKLLEARERMETIAGIRRGLKCIERGETQSAEAFFDELFEEFNIPAE